MKDRKNIENDKDNKLLNMVLLFILYMDEQKVSIKDRLYYIKEWQIKSFASLLSSLNNRKGNLELKVIVELSNMTDLKVKLEEFIKNFDRETIVPFVETLKEVTSIDLNIFKYNNYNMFDDEYVIPGTNTHLYYKNGRITSSKKPFYGEILKNNFKYDISYASNRTLNGISKIMNRKK